MHANKNVLTHKVKNKSKKDVFKRLAQESYPYNTGYSCNTKSASSMNLRSTNSISISFEINRKDHLHKPIKIS